MDIGERVSTWRFVVGGAALLAALSIVVPPASAGEVRDYKTLEIFAGAGPTIVAGSGCNWPEGEAYGPGSWVDVTVSTWFAGGGQTSTPVTLGEAEIVPSSGGGWEYVASKPPLAEVPAWATEIVVGAEAHCRQALGNGFDYRPAEARRGIDRPAAASTTTTTTVDQQDTTSNAVPAEPVGGTATFTG